MGSNPTQDSLSFSSKKSLVALGVCTCLAFPFMHSSACMLSSLHSNKYFYMCWFSQSPYISPRFLLGTIWDIRACLIVLFFADENECESGNHNCHPNANCTNLPATFECTCKSGYTGDGINCTSKL